MTPYGGKAYKLPRSAEADQDEWSDGKRLPNHISIQPLLRARLASEPVPLCFYSNPGCNTSIPLKYIFLFESVKPHVTRRGHVVVFHVSRSHVGQADAFSLFCT